MATPADGEFVISQGDSLPIMRILIPANSAQQLIDLTGCTVTFLGRIAGTRNYPPPIVRRIDHFAQETVDGNLVVVVYVRFTTTDTKAVAVPTGETYAAMQGELEIVSATGDVLTIPSLGYLVWWIRDDVGDGVA